MGHAYTTVFYLQLTGGSITSADLNTLATNIAASWNTNITGQISNQVTLTLTEIVYVPSVGNELVGSHSSSYAGASASAIVPDASACAVINWNINAYYRGGHPRMYQPGVISADVTNGSDIASALTSGLATAWNAVRTAINAMTTTNISAVQMGTMSFQSGNSWRGTPLFRPYQGCSVRAKLGSQRRRILS